MKLADYKIVKIDKPLDLKKNQAKRVIVENLSIWVCNLNDEVKILFDECAHMGGNLKFNGNKLVCESHGWTYNLDGSNLINFSPALRTIRIIAESENMLEILLPKKESPFTQKELTENLKLSIHSHATLELAYKNSNVLFDPWLEGPAYYGSWHLFPKPKIKANEIKADAIVITHPHPDHFHIPTLELMNKQTPIFFPSFPSRLIEKALHKAGFLNINPLLWEECTEVANNIKITFLRPRSMWEDSATLTQIFEVENIFNWLNLVDAGAIFDDFALPNIDLLSSAFNQGASGYPMTWSHLSDSRKIKILEAQKNNTLKLLPNKSKRVSAKYFLPFAGHWRLGLEQHQRYSEMIPNTSFQELEAAFLDNAPEVKFLGLYPGESYDFYSEKFTVDVRSREEIEIGFILEDKFQLTPKHSNFESKLERQMGILQSSCEAFGVENVHFTIKCKEASYSKVFRFYSSLSLDTPAINITVEMPSYILWLFSLGEANWDHIAIGYWGEWFREPDVYPTNFMRLLQSGYPIQPLNKNQQHFTDIDSVLRMPIGDIVEKNPKIASSILSRLGLPCLSCSRINSENLSQALSIHNIDQTANLWLIRELTGLLDQS
jgi:CMP-N-acetylneuraminate monooxygenase